MTFSNKFFLEKAVVFNNRGESLLKIALHRNWLLNADLNKTFTKVYDCSDHGAFSFFLECPHVDAKPIILNLWSFGTADYTQMKEMLIIKHSETNCFSKINRMSEWVKECYIT